MSLKLREFIKKIRSCKTADEERCLVNKESAHIRNLTKEQAEKYRVRSLVKCMFIGLLGYPTEFIHMTCLSLLASQKFTEKKFGYLGVGILLNEHSEILLLTAHTIAKDLESPNQYIVSSALQAIGEIGTPDMCREASSAIMKCLLSSNPYIKKKAAATLTKVINNCPELLDSVADKLNLIFEDKHHGVLICGLALVVSIFKKEEKYIKKYKKCVPQLLKILKSITTSSYTQDYDINGITDPFLQTKLLEAIGLFAKVYDDKNDEITNLLTTIPGTTESSTKNTGNAVLYELVRTIFSYECQSGLKTIGSSIIGKFLESKDNNIKYIALNLLQDIARIDLNIVQKHKNMILEFLSDLDISIKKRSLDLTYLIINETNIKHIVNESLAFLSINDNHDFRVELSTKIFESLEKYSPSLKWEIDTLIKMLCISDNILSEDVISRSVNLFLSVTELYKYSMFRMFIAMRENIKQESLLKVGVYLLGELGEYIINSSAVNDHNETITISEKDVIDLIQKIINTRDVSENVKELIMNCCFKLMPKFSIESNEEFKHIFEQESRSFLCEVQERANEYLVFTQVANINFHKDVAKTIPLKKDINMEEIISKPLINEDADDEKNHGYQSLINDQGKPMTTINNNVKENSKVKENDQIASGGVSGNNALFDLFSNPIEVTIPKTHNNPNDIQNKNSNTNNMFPDIFDLQNLISNNPPQEINPNSIFDQLNEVLQSQQQQTHMQGQGQDIMSINPQMISNPPIASNEIPLTNPMSLNQLQSESEPKMILVYQNADISIYSFLTKSNTSYSGYFYASNNTDKRLSNVKIMFLAKKNVQFKVILTTGNDLEPNASLGIKKEISIQNNDPSKPIVIKIQMNYVKEGHEIQDSCTCDNIQ